MQIHILSRKAIENLAKTPFAPDTAVISITDFGTEYAQLENEPKYLLQLVFDDVDNDVFLDHPRLKHETVERKYHMYTTLHARAVARFYAQIKDTAKVLICQCEHGQSRSAAIAAAIMEHRDKNGIEVFVDDNLWPNKMVFKKTLEELKKPIKKR